MSSVCLSILHLYCLTSITFAVQIKKILNVQSKNLPVCLGLGFAGVISKPTAYWYYSASMATFIHVGTSMAVVPSHHLE